MYSMKYANVHRFANSALPTSSSFHKNCSSASIDDNAHRFSVKRRRSEKSIDKAEHRTNRHNRSIGRPSLNGVISIDHAEPDDQVFLIDEQIKSEKPIDDLSIDFNRTKIDRSEGHWSIDNSPPHSTNFSVLDDVRCGGRRAGRPEAEGRDGDDDVQGESGADETFGCYFCTLCGRGCPTEQHLAAHVEKIHAETIEQTGGVGSDEDDVIVSMPLSSNDCNDHSAISNLNHQALISSSISVPSESPSCRRQWSDDLPPTSFNDSLLSASPSSSLRRRQTLNDAEFSTSTALLRSQTPQRRASEDGQTPPSLGGKNVSSFGELSPPSNRSPPSTRRTVKRSRPVDGLATPSPSGGSLASSIFTYACKLCPRTFGAASTLNVHYTHTHRDKPQYDCEMCGAQFAVKRELATHRRLHDGQPTHRCHRCGKEFGTKQLLRKHELWHTGERTHVCPQCSKAFFQKGHLTQHLMIHAGGRPHACRLCPKTFIFKFDLNRHMKIHAERVIMANESQDEPSINKNFTLEIQQNERQNEAECKYANSENFSVNDICEDGEDSEDFDLVDQIQGSGSSLTNQNSEDYVISQNSNSATSSLLNFDSFSNMLINGRSVSLLSNAANNWAGLRDHLANLHIGQFLAPILDQQMRRHSTEIDSSGQTLSNDLDRRESWPIANGNPAPSSNPSAVISEKSCDETTSCDQKKSSHLPIDMHTSNCSPVPKKICNGIVENTKKLVFYDSIISQRSQVSPHKMDSCRQCLTLSQQLATCQEKIESLENVVREKQSEIESLKCNVQHVGCLAGTLFKVCAEYETLWLASDREVGDYVRRFLAAFR